MAKGQLRSSREKKKPKQSKIKPAAPPSRFAPQGTTIDPAANKKKW